jgi:hypothetical protein
MADEAKGDKDEVCRTSVLCVVVYLMRHVYNVYMFYHITLPSGPSSLSPEFNFRFLLVRAATRTVVMVGGGTTGGGGGRRKILTIWGFGAFRTHVWMPAQHIYMHIHATYTCPCTHILSPAKLVP